MTECQGCGAWNDRSRARCVLCGTPLGEIDEWDATDELPPLPPLPDGGLAATMPNWLRDLASPALPMPAPLGSSPAPAPLPATPHSLPLLPALPPLGAQADPRTFLAEEDFPRWLHVLAAQQAARKPSVPSSALAPAEPVPVPVPVPVSVPVSADVIWPSHVASPLPASATAPAAEIAVMPLLADEALQDMVAPPPLQDRRVRSSWETLLLIALFIGLVVAAIWALVVNGVFSPAVTP